MLCVALYIIQAMLLCSVAVRDVKHPVRALAWLIIGIVLPFVGVGLYFVLYRRLPAQSRKQTGESPGKPDSTEVPPAISTPSGRNICRIVTHMTRAPAVPAECTVYSDGRAMYHALLRALRQARHSIDLEFYIFRADHIGMRVVDVLCEQARAGVRVRWIRDGVGSRSLPKAVVDRCEAAGIRCRVFYPVRFPWLSPRLNRRDHRKIVVVDGERAFVGGMNIGDEYTGQKDDVGRWRDTHLHIVGGGACRELSRVFERAWTLSSEERRRNNPSRHPRAVTDRLATEFSAEVAPPAHRPPPSSTHQGWVQTVDSGPDYPIPSVRNLFFAGLTQSESSVDIITPYFIPDTDLLTAMKVAVHKGFAFVCWYRSSRITRRWDTSPERFIRNCCGPASTCICTKKACCMRK
ncbi:hypothetical protein GCM10025857_00940 [Alicyclobacillus contaminans]|nr:hypothetical protein GCM10025857_00940 [Alicyclobacillus contaminans]